MEMHHMSILQLLNDGWIATYPLILFSIIMVAVFGERLFAMSGIASSAKAVTNLVVPPLSRGDIPSAVQVCEKQKNASQSDVYKKLLEEHRGTAPDDMLEILDEKRFEDIHDLKNHIWMLGTIGSSAPFIGLFGTVVGIIKSFHSMAMAGTGGFAVVAGGISEALVATAAGLIVAILAVIAYNYLQVRVANINAVLRINHAKFFHALKQGRLNDGARQA